MVCELTAIRGKRRCVKAEYANINIVLILSERPIIVYVLRARNNVAVFLMTIMRFFVIKDIIHAFGELTPSLSYSYTDWEDLFPNAERIFLLEE